MGLFGPPNVDKMKAQSRSWKILTILAVALLCSACSGSKLTTRIVTTPTMQVISTPTPNLQTIVPEAGALCDAALSGTASPPDRFAKPGEGILYLLGLTYKDIGWSVYGDADWPRGAASADQVQTVVCVQESRVASGRYTDGKTAYQRSWKVVAVSYPDGILYATQIMLGQKPPEIKTEDGDAYGPIPPQAAAWMRTLMQMESVELKSFVADIMIAPDGSRLVVSAISDKKGEFSIWDLDSGQHMLTWAHPSWAAGMALLPDGQTVLAAAQEAAVRWDAASGERLALACCDGYPTGGVFDAAISWDGSVLAVMGDHPREILWWDVASGALLGSVRLVSSSDQVRLALAPDGSTLAYGYVGGESSKATNPVRVLDTTTGEVVIELPSRAFLGMLAFSPDGKRLLVVDRGKGATARLWDIESSRLPAQSWDIKRLPVSVLAQPELVWRSAAFSPDGATLALSEGGIEAARVLLYRYDDNGLAELAAIDVAPYPDTLAFSTDGRTLVIGNPYEHRLYLWSLPGAD